MKAYIYILCLGFLFISCGNDSNTKGNKSTSSIPAIADIDKLLEKSPNNPSLLFERAKVFYEKEGYQEAIDDLDLAISIDSMQPDYHHLLADSYMDYYQSRNAVEALKRALTIFPNRTITQLKLSEFHLILKQYDQSVQLAGEILAREPQNAEAYFMMGLNYRAKGDTLRSINSFQAAVENDPELIDAWLILGNLFEAKDDPLAIDYYNGALAADPNSITAKHSKAFFLQNHNDLAGAIKLYEEIMLFDRSYLDAPLNAGILYLEQDSVPRALEMFNILVENVPQNPVGHYYRGLCHEALQQSEVAAEDFQNALNLDPEYIRAEQGLKRVMQ